MATFVLYHSSINGQSGPVSKSDLEDGEVPIPTFLVQASNEMTDGLEREIGTFLPRINGPVELASATDLKDMVDIPIPMRLVQALSKKIRGLPEEIVP
jgi:hypothetical protein